MRSPCGECKKSFRSKSLQYCMGKYLCGHCRNRNTEKMPNVEGVFK